MKIDIIYHFRGVLLSELLGKPLVPNPGIVLTASADLTPEEIVKLSETYDVMLTRRDGLTRLYLDDKGKMFRML